MVKLCSHGSPETRSVDLNSFKLRIHLCAGTKGRHHQLARSSCCSVLGARIIDVDQHARQKQIILREIKQIIIDRFFSFLPFFFQ